MFRLTEPFSGSIQTFEGNKPFPLPKSKRQPEDS